MIGSAKGTLAGAALALLTAAAAPVAVPQALARSEPGLWEISGQPLYARPQRLCLRNLAILAQLEHRKSRCTRVVLRDKPTRAEIHYTCAGGGFGRSEIEMVTPRSLRVETQGIAGSAPFNYVFQARRIGECKIH